MDSENKFPRTECFVGLKNLRADALHLGAKFLYTECFCLEKEDLYKC